MWGRERREGGTRHAGGGCVFALLRPRGSFGLIKPACAAYHGPLSSKQSQSVKQPLNSRQPAAATTRGRPKRTDAMIKARRSQICTAAIERFCSDGYRATTMQSIADTAGMSVGLIYDYFRDKEDLLIFSMNDVLDAYVREVRVAITDKTDPYEQFVAAVHAFGRVVDERRRAWLIAYREFHGLSAAQRKQILDRDIATTKLIEDRIVACVQAGLFHPVDAQMLTYHILLLVHGWALSAWRLPRMTCQAYIDSGLAILLKPVLIGEGPRPERHEQPTAQGSAVIASALGLQD